MKLEIEILDKIIGEPNEDGYSTTSVSVKYTINGTEILREVPIFNPQSDSDIMTGIANRGLTELAIYSGGTIII
jgi:hypothetical protein